MTAASARSQTRANRVKSSSFPATIAPIAVAWTVSLLRWAYQALKPPPPKICGSPDGPPVTSPRIKLGDGRHLAYREAGVPKEGAKYKIVVIHGFDSSKDLVYLHLNDPNPTCIVKSEAYDVQELADKLQIGSMFYVIGISMGAYPVYTFLKYIPHRHVAQFVYKLQ